MNTKEHFEKNVLPFFNLKEYFEKGFRGQGIIVASVESSTSSHGAMVKDTVLTYSPECTFISYNDTHDTSATSGYSNNNDSWSNFGNFADWCVENKVDIVTSSLDWNCDSKEAQYGIKTLYDNGIIFCNCAGNSGKEIKLDDEIRKTYNVGKEIITVSGICYSTSKKLSWSNFNYGNAVDVCAIGTSTPTISENGTFYSWSGTSSATPMCAGMLATYKSYDKTLNSKNVFEKIINKLNTTYEYKNFTHKILILPDMEEKEIKMEDKDWQIEFDECWERATKLKIVDGTRRNENVTRNELIVILDRLGLLDKLS